jgi:membrane protease YdiL (CAAX protease family)
LREARKPSIRDGAMLVMVSFLLLVVLSSATHDGSALVGTATLELLAVLLPVLILLRAEGLDLREVLALRRVPASVILLSLTVGAAAWVPATALSNLALWLWTLVGRTPLSNAPALKTPGELVAAILVFAILTSLAEESLFRGFLYEVYKPSGAMTAAVVSATLFAMFHASLVAVVPAFLMGWLLGVLRGRFDSLWPAIAAHFAHNTVALVASFAIGPETAGELPTPSDLAWLFAASAGAICVLVACRQVASRLWRPPTGPPPEPDARGRIADQLRRTLATWPVRVVVFVFALGMLLELLYVLGKLNVGG